MKLNALILILLLGQLLSAQPEVDWWKQYGGTKNDDLSNIEIGNNNHYLLSGFSTSLDFDVEGNNGEEDYWIVHTDDSGEILHTFSFGGSGIDKALTTKQISTDRFVTVGTIYSLQADGDIEMHYGNRDIWIIEYDASGTILKQATFGKQEDDAPLDFLVLENNSYLLLGYSESIDTISELDINIHKDVLLLQLDDNFNVIKEKRFGGSENDVGKQMLLNETEERVLIAGSSRSADGDLASNYGFWDIWMYQVDINSFEILENHSFGTIDSEVFSEMIQVEDGYIMLAETNSPQVPSFYSLGDFWVAKLNFDFEIEWEYAYGGESQDTPYGLVQIQTGEILAFGLSQSYLGEVESITGGTSIDAWLFVVDSESGEFIEGRTYGGFNEDYFYDATVDKRGNFVAIGSTDSNDLDFSRHGLHEGFVMSFGPLGGEIPYTHIRSSNSEQIQIENDILYVPREFSNGNIIVYNTLGQIIWKGKMASDQLAISTIGNRGMNVVHIQSSESGHSIATIFYTE